jgi:flagellin-like hook-associated protein FlgL
MDCLKVWQKYNTKQKGTVAVMPGRKFVFTASNVFSFPMGPLAFTAHLKYAPINDTTTKCGIYVILNTHQNPAYAIYLDELQKSWLEQKEKNRIAGLKSEIKDLSKEKKGKEKEVKKINKEIDKAEGDVKKEESKINANKSELDKNKDKISANENEIKSIEKEISDFDVKGKNKDFEQIFIETIEDQ